MTTNTVWLIVVIVWLLLAAFSGLPSILSLTTKSRKWRWLRKIYWNKTKRRIADNIRSSVDYRVHIYFVKYLDRSIAAREVYLDRGFKTFAHEMVDVIEDLQRFVIKYQHNTFNNLTRWEENYIDEFYKKQRRKKDGL